MSQSQRAPSSPCDATWSLAGGGGGVPRRHARLQSPVRGRSASATPSWPSWRWSSTSMMDDGNNADDECGVVVVPARGTETPATRARMPGLSRCASPEARARIGAASPGTARRVAVRLYDSLRRHGLRQEANRAFRDAVVADGDAAADGGGGGATEPELTGMACLLKDGFVGYLRELAKITPPVPKQVVKFCGITYLAKIERAAFSYETFGNKLLEYFVQPIRSLSLSKRSAELQILKGIDGYNMPGSMTLVLGPPGSGKITLLKILAARADPGQDSRLSGIVNYNEKTTSEVRKSRLIAYVCGQLNKLSLETEMKLSNKLFLTFGQNWEKTWKPKVRETLEFARDCMQVLRPENFTPQMRKFFAYALIEGQDPFLEYVMQILDPKKIENCLVSGISDTDRDKLAIAELALGTYSVMVYDQPLTGSDLAMTYDLVNTIRAVCRIQQSSTVMALNHLSQEAFDLFDRIILLGEGHVLYQGPRQDAVTYFAQLGYMKPSHVESWEFLQDIAAENRMQYLLPRLTPRGLEELVECYYSSDHYLDIVRVIGKNKEFSTYWVESEPGIGLSLKESSTLNSNAEHQEMVVAKLLNKSGSATGAESTGNIQVGDVSNVDELRWEQFKRPYVQPWWKSTRTLIQRQLRILKQLQMLSTLRIIQRPTFYKHRDQRFFRTSSYVVPHCISNLPQAFTEALLYSVCVYFLAGLTLENSGVVFLDYLVLMFLVAYFGSSFFFFLSAVAPIPEAANALAGRYKFLESPKLASSSTTVISEDENASVRSWREEFRVKIDSEQLTIPVTLMTLSFLELSFVSMTRLSGDRCGKATKEEAIDFENVSGCARPGIMLALVGGANRSVATLLKCLSGLDSSGTSAILKILSQLPVCSQSVIATFNYPNTRALSHFHQVIVLTQEGRQAYFGPVGLNCHEILGYFTAIPRVPHYLQTQNPISFVMGVTGLGIPRKKLAVTDFADEFQNSHLYEVAMKVINTAMKNNKHGNEKDHNMRSISYNYPVSFIRQIGLVLLRTQRFLWRNVNYTYSRFTGCVMIGLLMGSLYFKIKYEDTYEVTSRSLYIYTQTILIGVISANNVIPQIGTDKLAYFREMRSKMYLPIIYPVSWVISEIPYFLIATLAFVGIGNGMAGIATQTAADFLAYWSVLFLFHTLYDLLWHDDHFPGSEPDPRRLPRLHNHIVVDLCL
ncbi:unnamed protein product [Miscanthus lutarioriparius]|uniref:ABC transporter domain-containing protein n=1 Tax=Miscanthus lutarioriparius TaxID=422564 RepID=A0A811RB65_9POAL|nr:unnamed protein product [Miscanthus lutarioriparius]